MGQVTTPDGRVIFVPDSLGFGAPPVAPMLAGAPNAGPSTVAPPPSPLGFLTPETRAAIGLPSMVEPPQTAPQDAAVPVQNSPDVTVEPPAEPKFGKALAKSNKTYDARQSQIAAYNASPEGRAAAAEQEGLGAIGDQQAIAQAVGEVASQEAQTLAQTLEERNRDLQEQRMDAEKLERDRAKGLAERQGAYDKAIDAEASYKIDEGRKWRNASTGSKVLAGIGVAMTALGDALQYKSGPNLAIQMIQQAIRDDVDAQVRERENLGKVVDRRRNSIDQYRQMTGDLREAANLKIAEEYKRAADQMEMTAQKFADPKAKLQAAQNAAVLRGEAAKLSAGAAESAFNRETTRQQLANSRAQIGLGYANLKENRRQFDQGFEQRKNELLLQAAKLDQEGNAAQAKATREQLQKELQFGVSGNVVEVKNPDGTVGFKHDILKLKDGTPFQAPTEAEAIKNREQKAAVDTINEFTNRMVRGIAEHGGESQFFKSAEWQQMTADKTFIANALRVSNGMGTLDKGSMEAIEAMMGATDPTSYWQNASPGLLQARNNTLAAYNNRLRSQNANVEEYKPPDTSKPMAPTSSAGDSLQKTALTPAVETDPAQNRRDLGVSGDEGLLDLVDKFQGGAVGGMMPSKKQALDTLYALSKSTDAKVAEENRLRLKAVAESKTSDPKVSEYANTLLGALSR